MSVALGVSRGQEILPSSPASVPCQWNKDQLQGGLGTHHSILDVVSQDLLTTPRQELYGSNNTPGEASTLQSSNDFSRDPIENSPYLEQSKGGFRPITSNFLSQPASERLDSRYQILKSKSFRLGFVFSVLWTEPAGEGSERGVSLAISTTRYGENAFSKIRRFVVVRSAYGHSSCLPLLTYGGQGTTKHGIDAKLHAAVFAENGRVKLAPGENMQKEPFPITFSDPFESLDAMTRLNFSKVYTVEHNLKVHEIGQVSEKHLGRLHQYFVETMTRPDPPLARADEQEPLNLPTTSSEVTPQNAKSIKNLDDDRADGPTYDNLQEDAQHLYPYCPPIQSSALQTSLPSGTMDPSNANFGNIPPIFTGAENSFSPVSNWATQRSLLPTSHLGLHSWPLPSPGPGYTSNTGFNDAFNSTDVTMDWSSELQSPEPGPPLSTEAPRLSQTSLSGSNNSPNNGISCTHCPLKFKRDSDRIRHENSLHLNRYGAYLCSVTGCPKSQRIGFSRADKLTEHMWKKHGNLGYTKNV